MIFATLFVALVPVTAPNGEERAPESESGARGEMQGTKVLELSGSLKALGTDSDSYGQTDYTLQGGISYGVFATDNLRVQLNYNGSLNFNNNSDVTTGQSSVELQGKYFVDPYARGSMFFGPQAGVTWSGNGDDVESNVSYGGLVGYNLFVSDSHDFSVFFQYSLLLYQNDIATASGSESADIYDNTLQVGFEWWF